MKYKCLDGYSLDITYKSRFDQYATAEEIIKENDDHDLAEEVAEDYYENHGGEDRPDSWPLSFVITTDGGELVGTYSVLLEWSPLFTTE